MNRITTIWWEVSFYGHIPSWPPLSLHTSDDATRYWTKSNAFPVSRRLTLPALNFDSLLFWWRKAIWVALSISAGRYSVTKIPFLGRCHSHWGTPGILSKCSVHWQRSLFLDVISSLSCDVRSSEPKKHHATCRARFCDVKVWSVILTGWKIVSSSKW